MMKVTFESTFDVCLHLIIVRKHFVQQSDTIHGLKFEFGRNRGKKIETIMLSERVVYGINRKIDDGFIYELRNTMI